MIEKPQRALENAEDDLWAIADAFRSWVTDEIGKLAAHEREHLRGDYLFVVDDEPRFVVVVEKPGAWSGKIERGTTFRAQIDGPVSYTDESLRALIEGAARSTVVTDAVTLKRLLLGTLRASVSFVSGRVKIQGDLAAFMRLVSSLKRQGVRPIGVT